MIEQPFAFLGNGLLMARSDGIYWVRADCGECRICRLPHVPPSLPAMLQYIAVDEAARVAMAVDVLRPRLVEVSFADDLVVRGIPWKGPGDSPRSIVHGFGKWWLTLRMEGLGERICTVGTAGGHVAGNYQISEVESKDAALYGGGTLFKLASSVVLFDGVMGNLQVLDENGQVIRAETISADSVLGPSITNALVLYEPVAEGYRLWHVQEPMVRSLLAEDLRRPWGNVSGLAMSESGRVLLLDSQSELFLSSPHFVGWETVTPDWTTMDVDSIVDDISYPTRDRRG